LRQILRDAVLRADVSNESEAQQMFATAIDYFRTLHLVVSNAGLQRDAPFDKMILAHGIR
jgi:glucose 1-dehydrogenase